MATLESLTDDVYSMLYGMAQVERPAEDTLATAVTNAADVSWQFDTETLWKRGDYAEDATAGELVVFAENHPTATDVTVRREQRSTTAAASYAIGDVFYRNPTFPRFMVERFINETIDNDLWPNVWMWGETSLSYLTGDTTYEMPVTCGDVAQVYQTDLNADGRHYPIDQKDWTFVGLVNSAESTNQNFLRLRRVVDETATVYVTYKEKPLSSDIASLSDPVAAMVPWKVVGKLLMGTRVVPARIDPARSTPITQQSGSQLVRDYASYDVEFRRMRQDESNRLKKQVPTQKRWQGNRVRIW